VVGAIFGLCLSKLVRVFPVLVNICCCVRKSEGKSTTKDNSVRSSPAERDDLDAVPSLRRTSSSIHRNCSTSLTTVARQSQVLAQSTGGAEPDDTAWRWAADADQPTSSPAYRDLGLDQPRRRSDKPQIGRHRQLDAGDSDVLPPSTDRLHAFTPASSPRRLPASASLTDDDVTPHRYDVIDDPCDVSGDVPWRVAASDAASAHDDSGETSVPTTRLETVL